MPSPADSPEVQIRQALQLLQQGYPAPAESLCRQALAAQPDSIGALSILGLAVNAQHRYREASQVFAELTRRDPAERSHWVNLGTALRADLRFDEALSAYARAAQLGEISPDFFYNVGLLHLDRGDFVSARDVLGRAHALAPDDAEIAFYAAQCSYECLRTDEAVERLSGWDRFHNLSSELAAKIALLLMNLREPKLADALLSRATADPSPQPSTLLNIVQIQERTNRLPEARVGLEKLKANTHVSSLREELTAADAQLAQREGRHEEASRLFSQALDSCAELHRRHHQLFPLAKSLDALKRYDEAYEVLVQAHASQLEMLKLTAPEAALRKAPTLLITEYSCDPADVLTWNDADAPPAEASPVFIVAFPRSGTTLLEQTLDAHPLLQSMDEQPYLQHAIDYLMNQGIDYPAGLGRASAVLIEETRARYWAESRKRVDLSPAQRLVDKNPLNLLRLPVIRRLFPNARILVAIRHPCDVIMSCFMQHFRAMEFVIMCKDLQTLAGGYHRSFDFWYQQAQLLNPNVHEIRYESFVTHFESQVRAVSTFLQLPWDERMLAPGKHASDKGFISTPSYAQVVQPVNSSSIGRWRPYARHFTEVIPLVRPLLERWGYEA